MRILGIDPGLEGALCLLDTETNAVEIIDMPTLKLKVGKGSKNVIDPFALGAWVDGRNKNGIDQAWLERVSSSSQMGVTSAFTFGEGYGIVRGVLAANFIPTERVTPASWKAALKVPAEKDGAIARASEMFPRDIHHWPLKKHDGRAEARLIAHYGAQHGTR